MNPIQPCDTIELDDLLQDDCDLTRQSEIERHLESCEHCQSRLSRLAADDEFWTQTAAQLSTVEQIELPERLTSRLNSTSAFVIPTIESQSLSSINSAATSASDAGWTRVLDPPSHPEMLGKIDQFEVDSKIGQGGMGIVLKGFDRELNRAVAIKILAPYLASNGTARKRFAREAQAAAAVVHPNVVPIYSVNSSPTRPYIVMQLVPGNSLQTLVQQKGPLEPKDIVRVSMQIAAGLAAAHNQGLIHRDVKPGNILIERDVSRVMITDFGLARAVDDAGMTQTGWLAGTPHYMSPEQSRGDDLDPRSDLFSLGSLMYFLATGREPFRGERPYAVIQKIINHEPTHPMELNADIPLALADMIEKLLEKDPRNRFQTAGEISHILEHYLAHLQQPKKTSAPKRILTARRKRRRSWIAAGLISLTSIALTAYFLIPRLFPTKTNGPSSATTTTNSVAEIPTEIIGQRQPETAIQPEPNTAAASTVPPALIFDDQAYSQQLDSLGQELDALENSFNQTTFLDFDRTGETDFSTSLQTEASKIEAEIQRLESTFDSEIQIRSLIDQINNSAERPAIEQNPLQNQPPENESSYQSETKRKNDEN
jgi:serine/threonine-protein kinase